MKRKRRWFSVSLPLLCFAAIGCGAHLGETKITNPDTGPGTSWPCGYTGVECFDVLPHDCCPMAHSCRTDSGGGYCHAEYQNPMSPMTIDGAAQRTNRFSAVVPPS